MTNVKHLKQNIVNKNLTPNQLVRILRKGLKNKNIIVSSCEHKPLDFGQSTINAYLDIETKEIEIVFVYASDLKKGMFFDNESWKNLSFRIEQAIEHENIHKKQYRKKRKIQAVLNPIKTRNYFCDPDEIDAHANDIALELLYYCSYTEAIKKLRNFTSVKPEESVTLFSYLVNFKYDISHKAIKSLLKQSFEYLNKKEGGN